MKKTTKMAALILSSVITFAACGPKSDIDGYKKTESGLHYKFEKENKGAQQVQMGDVLVAEMTLRLDDSVIFSNMGNPQRLFEVTKSVFPGDINEGLLMLHSGDVATFAIEADSMANYFPMPPFYKTGTKSKVYYDITLSSIVTKADIDKEKAEFEAKMEQAKKDEPELIAKYIADNHITQKPAENGLYIIEKKKGNGPKVENGKAVKINYTGKLLDGKVFDTSVETIAQEAGIYNPQRPYEPLSYVVGEMSLIPGWEQAVATLKQGSVATVIIPSELGYGARGTQGIPPFSPLVFDLEIISVQ